MLAFSMSLTWFLFLMCLFMGLAAWLIFMWAVRSGQFRDAEETAEQMLEWDNQEYERADSPSGDDETVTVGAQDDEKAR